MAVNYRLDPFAQHMETVSIAETLVISPVSPYYVRLSEVPHKAVPSTVKVDGFTEVASNPAAGQFWCDYNTDIEGWNTGLLLFNAADAGRTITVRYYGIGTLVDANNDFKHIALFTSSGSWRAPLGCFIVRATVVNGGGSGARGAFGNQFYPTGGAGGTSGAIMVVRTNVIPCKSYNVIVAGAGGQSSFAGISPLGTGYGGEAHGRPAGGPMAISSTGGNGASGYQISMGQGSLPHGASGAGGMAGHRPPGTGGQGGYGYGAGGGGGGGGAPEFASGNNEWPATAGGAGGAGAQGCVIIEY